jgi:hypothetical protein
VTRRSWFASLSLRRRNKALAANDQESARIERLKEIEDEVRLVIEHWPALKRAIAYKLLYNQGIRIAAVDGTIREEIKK